MIINLQVQLQNALKKNRHVLENVLETYFWYFLKAPGGAGGVFWAKLEKLAYVPTSNVPTPLLGSILLLHSLLPLSVYVICQQALT